METLSKLPKLASLEKSQNQRVDAGRAHEKWVPVRHGHEVAHPGNCSAIHSNFAIARRAENGGEERIVTAGAGDDARFEVDGRQLRGNRVLARSKLQPRWTREATVERTDERKTGEPIRELAACTRRSQHHDATNAS